MSKDHPRDMKINLVMSVMRSIGIRTEQMCCGAMTVWIRHIHSGPTPPPPPCPESKNCRKSAVLFKPLHS